MFGELGFPQPDEMNLERRDGSSSCSGKSDGGIARQLLIMAAICAVCVSIGVCCSDSFVMIYRAEVEAGHVDEGSVTALADHLVSIGKFPGGLAALLHGIALPGNDHPKALVRFIAWSCELIAVLICALASRRFLTNGCLAASVLPPLMFVLLTMGWNLGIAYNFCDQFGWHCISFTPQFLAVSVGGMINMANAKMKSTKLTSRIDIFLFAAFLSVLFFAVAYYDKAWGWVMHLG